MSNCKYCGRFSKSEFCNNNCKNEYQLLLNKPIKSFRSYIEAAHYLKKDTRVIRKWENIFFKIDKSIPNKRIQWKVCKTCNSKVPSAKCRQGYCKACSKKGLGKKEQGKIISKKYKGKNNPNYRDGKSIERQSFRCGKDYRSWRQQVLDMWDNKCAITAHNFDLHIHHILPAALFPNLVFEPWNGVPVRSYLHKEFHHQELDLVLLPILYESLQDVQQLALVFLRQPQVQKLGLLPEKQCHKLEILEVVPKNYYKRLQYHHPEFALQELGHLALQS